MSLFDKIFNRKKEPLEIPHSRISDLEDDLQAEFISVDNLQAKTINPSDISLTVGEINKGIEYINQG